MTDVSIPMDWQPGDAVIVISNKTNSGVGIVIEILKINAFGACVLVFWPHGVEAVNVDSITHAF